MFRCLSTEFLTNQTVKDRNSLTPSHKMCSSLRRLSRDPKLLRSMHGDLAHRMLTKSNRTCRNYGQNNGHAYKYTVGFTVPIFTKLILPQQIFVSNSYAEFHENPTNGLVPYTRSRTDGHRLHKRHSFFTL